MPVIELYRNVKFLSSTGVMVIHKSLCIPHRDEDEDYIDNLHPLVSTITVVNLHTYDPEWYVDFSDGASVMLNVQWKKHSRILDRLRTVLARGAYLAMRRRRMVWEALFMGTHRRLGAESPLRLIDDGIIVLLIKASV